MDIRQRNDFQLVLWSADELRERTDTRDIVLANAGGFLTMYAVI